VKTLLGAMPVTVKVACAPTKLCVSDAGSVEATTALNVAPPLSASVITTCVAVSGPLLVIVSV
jgi:hypothetical protein